MEIKREQLYSQGSALLITLIVMGLIAILSFGIARLVLFQIFNSQTAEDSMVAYHAAEAGLEEGLLIFRNNNNAEIGLDINGLATTGVGGDFTDAPRIVTIGSGPTASTYTLGMNYLDTKSKSGLNLGKDQVSVFRIIPPSSGMDLTLTWGYPTGDYCFQVIIDRSYLDKVSNTMVTKRFMPIVTAKSTQIDIPSASAASNIMIRAQVYIANITDCGSNLTTGGGTVPDNIQVTDLQLSVPSGVTERVIDTGTTTITSVGQYGRSTRKLVAEIDRSTGGLLHIFDYAIFSASGGISL